MPRDGPAGRRRAGEAALAAGRADAPLHHSDRCNQYTSKQFHRLMADHGIICSVSRAENVWNYAALESVSSLKAEPTARKIYRAPDEAKATAFDDIARFCNSRRRHSTIG